MSQYPDSVEALIASLKTLPGIGRRGAERLAVAMLKWSHRKQREFGTLIRELPEKVGVCPECGAMADAGTVCDICRSPIRDRSTICVVEDFSQLLSIEGSGNYRGLYHVLGGKLSPLDDRLEDSLSIDRLRERAAAGDVAEVIVALGSDVEARATAIYLAEILKETGVKVSQPAQGLPAGASFAYADGATIAAAFRGRTELQ